MLGLILLFILCLLFLQWTVEYVLKSRVRVCTDCGNFFSKEGWLLGYPRPHDSCPECGKDVPGLD
ncbi:hypothetical protein ACFQDG_03965 [Natronoarchaeum mannanilyticum]|uniref:Uncharacterized protein n=1 Tax=Natronoarchaeum mannanilyticum TaxID=926360 RepID=A0AAV3T5S5_9EURY